MKHILLIVLFCLLPAISEAQVRVAVIGDSTANIVGHRLARIADTTQRIQVFIDARNGSGLAQEDLYRWPYRARYDVWLWRPDIIVVALGRHDIVGIRSRTSFYEFDQPQWELAYRDHINNMLREVSNNNRRVYWLGVPSYSEQARRINQIFRRVISYHHNVVYLETARELDERFAEYARP